MVQFLHAPFDSTTISAPLLTACFEGVLFLLQHDPSTDVIRTAAGSTGAGAGAGIVGVGAAAGVGGAGGAPSNEAYDTQGTYDVCVCDLEGHVP